MRLRLFRMNMFSCVLFFVTMFSSYRTIASEDECEIPWKEKKWQIKNFETCEKLEESCDIGRKNFNHYDLKIFCQACLIKTIKKNPYKYSVSQGVENLGECSVGDEKISLLTKKAEISALEKKSKRQEISALEKKSKRQVIKFLIGEILNAKKENFDDAVKKDFDPYMVDYALVTLFEGSSSVVDTNSIDTNDANSLTASTTTTQATSPSSLIGPLTLPFDLSLDSLILNLDSLILNSGTTPSTQEAVTIKPSLSDFFTTMSEESLSTLLKDSREIVDEYFLSSCNNVFERYNLSEQWEIYSPFESILKDNVKSQVYDETTGVELYKQIPEDIFNSTYKSLKAKAQFKNLTEADLICILVSRWNRGNWAADYYGIGLEANLVGTNFCWRDSETRGVGTIPSGCPNGKEKRGLLCYNVGQIGLLNPSVMTCEEDEETDAGLCYRKCTDDSFEGIGPVCWQTKAPKEGWVECGAGFAESGDVCAEITFSQVWSVGQAIFSIVTMGAGSSVTAAVDTAKDAISSGTTAVSRGLSFSQKTISNVTTKITEIASHTIKTVDGVKKIIPATTQVSRYVTNFSDNIGTIVKSVSTVAGEVVPDLVMTADGISSIDYSGTDISAEVKKQIEDWEIMLAIIQAGKENIDTGTYGTDEYGNLFRWTYQGKYRAQQMLVGLNNFGRLKTELNNKIAKAYAFIAEVAVYDNSRTAMDVIALADPTGLSGVVSAFTYPKCSVGIRAE